MPHVWGVKHLLPADFEARSRAESSSRGSLHPEVDEAFYQRRWGAPKTCADPFFTTAIELLVPFSPRL